MDLIQGETGVRILLIEDDEQMRQALMNRLMAENVDTIYQARDFGGALELIPEADGIVCDDAFPFVSGEPPFPFAWMGMHDAARAQKKPFVLITADNRMWLDASHQNVEAYRTQHATEAIAHLVQAVHKHPPTTPTSHSAEPATSLSR
jgi:DNA-binding NarL/FixJ family response regulator